MRNFSMKDRFNIKIFWILFQWIYTKTIIKSLKLMKTFSNKNVFTLSYSVPITTSRSVHKNDDKKKKLEVFKKFSI